MGQVLVSSALHPRVLRQFYQLFRAIPSRVILHEQMEERHDSYQTFSRQDSESTEEWEVREGHIT